MVEQRAVNSPVAGSSPAPSASFGYIAFPEFGPDRYEPYVAVLQIRGALRRECGPGGRYDAIRFECFNKAERDAIDALLTPAERQRVFFSWWGWGN